MILNQKQFEEQNFAEWLEQGNIPIYKEPAGKDMGKYKILGLRKLCFETEQQARQYYINMCNKKDKI